MLFYITQNEFHFHDIVDLESKVKKFNIMLNKLYTTNPKDNLLQSDNLKLASKAFLENRTQEFQYIYNDLEAELKLVNRQYTLALVLENDEVIDCKLVE